MCDMVITKKKKFGRTYGNWGDNNFLSERC